jgi:phosphopantetheinyl transferase
VPVFFQQQINESTRLGVWKIEESEDFFKGNVPVHRDVTNPHKRLQHLAGRFLLPFLYPDFPYNLIEIADTRKPYLPDAEYHFSISHCGDYAAAIVSKDRRVGIDVEIPVFKILNLSDRFLHPQEKLLLQKVPGLPRKEFLTMFWSVKEAVFKWYGEGGVDFRRDINIKFIHSEKGYIDCFFRKINQPLTIYYKQFPNLCLSWIVN